VAERDSDAVAGELSRRRHRVGVKTFFFLNFFVLFYVFYSPDPFSNSEFRKKQPTTVDLEIKFRKYTSLFFRDRSVLWCDC